MKKAIISLLIFLVPAIVSADVYVYSNKTTKEVLFIVEEDTVSLSSEDVVDVERTVLPKDIDFYGLDESHTDYKLSGNKFVLNTKKISDREAKEIDDKDKKDKKDADFITAKAVLMTLGLTSDEVDSLK